jgi:hypothetical protein
MHVIRLDADPGRRSDRHPQQISALRPLQQVDDEGAGRRDDVPAAPPGQNDTLGQRLGLGRAATSGSTVSGPASASEGSSVSTAATSPERLSEVHRLTEALIDHVLEAQIVGRPVPHEQSEALIKAAFFLRDYKLPWWPMLAQALHGLGRDTDEAASEEATKAEALKDTNLEGLSRFFAGFQKGDGAS